MIIAGDTDSNAGNDPELVARAAWGGIFRVDLNPRPENVRIGIVILGDAAHSSLDSLTFTAPRCCLWKIAALAQPTNRQAALFQLSSMAKITSTMG